MGFFHPGLYVQDLLCQLAFGFLWGWMRGEERYLKGNVPHSFVQTADPERAMRRSYHLFVITSSFVPCI